MNLLIIRPAALGDSLMLMPSLCALKGMAETILVGRKPGIDFLAPYVLQAMDFESHGWHLLYGDEKERVPHLSLPLLDLAVLFHSDPHGEMASRLEDILPGVQVRVFPGFPPEHTETHAALYLALCLEASGCPINAAQAFEEALRVSPLKQSANDKRAKAVVIHPGSGSAKKNHPPQFWLDFAKRFSELYPFPLTLLLGPAEEALLPFFQGHLQGTAGAEILFCPDRSELLSSFSQAVLYAGQDSGITHLAAMIGAPTLALFRSSSIAQWRPLGPLVRTVESEESGPRLLDEALSKAAELQASTVSQKLCT
ncbi:MAG: glycosyltransferase family 9 protein [Desulfatiglandales bacterium]